MLMWVTWCENWSMTCWSSVECWETTLELATEGCSVVSHRILISILYMSVEPLEMSCAEAMHALAPSSREL